MSGSAPVRVPQVEDQLTALSSAVDILGDRILALKGLLEDGGYLTADDPLIVDGAPPPTPNLVNKAQRLWVNSTQLISMRDCIDSVIQRFEG